MRVGFDIRPIRVKYNGISTYTLNLRRKFKELKDENIEISLIDYNMNISKVPNKMLQFLWEQTILPIKLLILKIDIYHSTRDYNLPLLKVCKYISTIHDVIPLIYPDKYYNNKFKFMFYKLRLWISVRNSDIIITDSEHSKQDIIKYLKVAESKIKVVYLSVDTMVNTDDIYDNKILKDKFNITKKYVLGIGGLEYRKNVLNLIESFQIAEKEIKDCQLVIIGKRVSNFESDFNDNIIFTGFVDDKELISLYKNAEMFVYPSLYEGFGLPPLEAMVCGIPVITSNTTSIPEVVGDGAILIDPMDVNDIAKAIASLYDNEQFKGDLITKAKERLKFFSWDKTVESIIAIYGEIKNKAI